MFESLKKKFSRTSQKLTDELEEEAKQEDNYIEEEVPEKKSFFSFGKSKKEEEPVEDEEEVPQDEDKNEKKSSFFSFGTSNKDETDESLEEDEDTESEPQEKDKKSSFFSFGSSSNKENDGEDDEEESSDDEVEEKEEKSSFFSFGKKKDKKEEEVISEEVEENLPAVPEEVQEKKSRFSFGKPTKIFSFVREKTISEKHVENIFWELEIELLQGDVAMEVASKVVDSVKENLVGQKISRSSDIEEYTFKALQDAVREIIDIPGKSMTEMIEAKKAQGEPLVVMFVGINGTGKTTTIGKLANYYLKKGYTPVIAAADTFRAGAIEQVTFHADNVGVKIIKHQKGSDPAAVAYDAVEHAQAQGKELVLIDTAGRMQTNTNLMDEMKKIKRVSNPDLVIFVGDALTGNDATEQAAKFNDAIDLDGVILTKADADSKGGASLSIGYVIKKPIMFLGMGQGYDDIKEYDADWMMDQLFSFDDEEVVEEEA
ncbi:MAG: signal recognition particle-docking protein FtsY [archaeon]|nr:signal recognition particle-docking protein FtsY [archaeon]